MPVKMELRIYICYKYTCIVCTHTHTLVLHVLCIPEHALFVIDMVVVVELVYTFLIHVWNVAEEPGSECRYKMGCLRVGNHPTLCYQCAIQRNNVIDQ